MSSSGLDVPEAVSTIWLATIAPSPRVPFLRRITRSHRSLHIDHMYGTCRAFHYIGDFSETDADFVITVVPLTVRILSRKVGGTDSSWQSSTEAYYAVYQLLGRFCVVIKT